ncbi:MAG TPA: YfhO family protein [Thermoanaerobaculia bacterium]|nr:YfhO family protein [Thermoanaerobaculia bacterium]
MNPTWLYVGALYALVTWRVLPRRVALLFYALTLAFLFRPMTGPYNNVAPDVLKLMPPWQVAGFDKYAVSNFELQDVMFELAPWAEQARMQWRAGRVPLWNDLAGCGMPLLANMQSAALSPLRLLALPLPLAYALTAEAAMKILIALTFTFLYCRRRYDLVPSLIGAISFGFGTFVLSWLHYPIGATGAFLPAVLYAIDLLAEKRGFLLAAAMGPLLLSQGHPESVAHIAFIATAYALVTAPHTWKRLIAAAITSALLSAPILLPFLEAMPHTMRYQELEKESHADATAFSDFKSLALLVHPRIYGEHPDSNFWGPAVTEAVSGFCGILGIAGFFGLLLRRPSRHEAFYLIATVVLFLWLADVPIISAPMRALFSMALNARLRLPFSFFLAVQAAALVHHKKTMIPGVLGASAVIAFVFLRTNFPSPADRQFALLTLCPTLVVLVLSVLSRPKAILIAVYLELFLTSIAWNPVQRGTNLYPRTPLLEALLKLQTNQPYRIAAIGPPLFPNTNAIFNLADVRVHDPMANGRYLHLLRTTRDWDPKAYYEKWNDPDSALLDSLNVRWLLTEPRVELARYRLVYDGADGRVYENPRALPRFYGGTTTITAWRGDAYDLRVDAPHPTQIASSIAFWPGWRILYNGRALRPQRVNGAFLGFTIPAGSGVVRVRYVPFSFWGGALISLLTIAVLAIIRRRV